MVWQCDAARQPVYSLGELLLQARIHSFPRAAERGSRDDKFYHVDLQNECCQAEMASVPLYTAEQIVIPPGLPDILKQFTKAAIKTQPDDVYRWAAGDTHPSPYPHTLFRAFVSHPASTLPFRSPAQSDFCNCGSVSECPPP